MIDVVYTLSEDEYIEAQRAYLKAARNRWSPGVNGLTIFLLVCFAVVIATNPLHLHALVTPRAAPGLAIMALALSFPYLVKRGFKKRYLVERSGLTDVHVTLDEEGYKAESAGQGKGEIPWSGLSSCVETPRLLLLIKAIPSAPYQSASSLTHS